MTVTIVVGLACLLGRKAGCQLLAIWQTTRFIHLHIALALSCLLLWLCLWGRPTFPLFIGILPIAGHKFDYFSGQDYGDFRRPFGCQLAGVKALIKIFDCSRNNSIKSITHTPW